ncbi:hypothetical protein AAFC00_001285 [Neodothiora populina]|uniref:coproporphyrinogen oxidase n=1 Tax=Neodothiora populina TaxID=2781224 RepID=A0ABR3PNE3_9PEZI
MNTSPLISALRRSAQSTRTSTLSRTVRLRDVRLNKTQARWIGDHGGRPPHPPGAQEPSRVIAPKTRIAVGIVFVGSLIYSMATGNVEHTEAPSIAERDQLSKRESGVTQASPMRLRMEKFIKEKQEEIVRALEEVDGTRFTIDKWDRPNGGGGITCVLQDGKVFEKGESTHQLSTVRYRERQSLKCESITRRWIPMSRVWSFLLPA